MILLCRIDRNSGLNEKPDQVTNSNSTNKLQNSSKATIAGKRFFTAFLCIYSFHIQNLVILGRTEANILYTQQREHQMHLKEICRLLQSFISHFNFLRSTLHSLCFPIRLSKGIMVFHGSWTMVDSMRVTDKKLFAKP